MLPFKGASVISIRSLSTAGIAMIAAGAITLTPAMQPLPAEHLTPAVTASAQVVRQPVWPAVNLLASTGVLSDPPVPTAFLSASNINHAIKDTYNRFEPWVQYGFEVAAYVVAWIPIVDWFAPQITILYDFGE